MARVTLRLPDDLHQRLVADSQKLNVSMNELAVAALRDGLARQEAERSAERSLSEQVRRLRSVLGDLVVDIDVNQFPAAVRPNAQMPDRDDLFNSLPRLNPPLSATVIEEREDRI
jgi:hypothetical protein